VETARSLGLLDALEPGPVSLTELSGRFGLRPARLYKFLDCLESLGLVERRQESDALGEARFRAVPGLRSAAEAVLGPASLERDRDPYPWRTLQGRLPEVLRGEHGIAPEAFDWPPRTSAQVEGFEASMAAGLGPILETFSAHRDRLFGTRPSRLLDIGGGDGTLATRLLAQSPALQVDVYNLPSVEPLVSRRRASAGVGARLGFVAGNFLEEPLPEGYDALSFVRVLHDWPAEISRQLLVKAYAALAPGGRVLICEELRTPERLAAQFFWTYFLIGLDTCSSRLREVEWYTRALEEVGFSRIEVLSGPFELLVAEKGGSAAR
jgi:SAM-dependent methyltransferase